MLKALELLGFKSFADRTRFDFPEGITAVVGPNGSGKSNVVDAIKWVLGAHSAKAIRGSDMTDVIFKGSAEGGRKPANSAEVILILDNRARMLTLDADEVHVCRRVYRSGEGEYAINGQPCRLKDVRDLFRGTGVGVDSYSLIEQGKVDRLLQSSAKDRRAIFEEAAGISRFKAKKAEAERRLARVDQNMLRIHDIVDELGKRLSTLKQQASKAQRYRDWIQQSTQKRTLLGWIDLRELDAQRQTLDQRSLESAHLRDACRNQVAQARDLVRQRQAALDQTLRDLDASSQRLSVCLKEHVHAAGEQSLIEQRQLERSSQRSTLVERIEALERRVTIGEEEIFERKRAVQQFEAECQTAGDRAGQLEGELRGREARLSEARREGDALRSRRETVRQRLAQIRVDASAQFKALESTETELLRIGQQIAEKSASIDRLQHALEELHREWDAAKREYNDAENAKHQAKQQHEEILQQARREQQVCLELQTRIQGLNERSALLEQLEDQFANAGRGGQQLMRCALELAKSHPMFETANASLLGIVADLIRSDLHLAPLVDVALGTYADAIVLGDGRWIDWINEGRLVPEGRVTLLRMDRLPTRRTGERIQLDGLRGVLGRADRLVRFDTQHEPLVRALLGTTWFVESLATALDLSHFRGAGLRFVTAECQVVDSDGSITIGSLQTGLGLVSRRSEMQAAAEQIRSLHASLSDAKIALDSVEQTQTAASQRSHHADLHVLACARRVAGIEQKLDSTRTQLQGETASLESLHEALENTKTRRMQLDQSLNQLDQERVDREQEECAMAAELDNLAARMQHCEEECRAAQQLLVDHRIESARQEQRLDGLRITLQQLLEDASERSSHLETARLQLSQLDKQIADADLKQAELSQRVANLELMMADLEQRRRRCDAERDLQQQAVNESSRQLDHLVRQLEKLDDRIAALNDEDLRLNQQRSQLVDRYLDEYQIDLLQDRGDERDLESSSRVEIEAQLAHLRHEIAAAGSVNMEALAELDELQARYDRLAAQEQDLIDAKDSLVQTMLKIDEDSRSLFRETLETIRTNFQQLYRKSFGGGSADIILENPDDPESGIEIFATPPGKTSFSNTLLSGGEKALTAVALIMAFFQYRPSPFCILDEVDAPFDEANIGRFVAVLNEFLDSTKFIIVTHSKKTMTVANMIYGVTMQESGVSRQVAVKFEEVDDSGEIVRRAA